MLVLLRTNFLSLLKLMMLTCCVYIIIVPINIVIVHSIFLFNIFHVLLIYFFALNYLIMINTSKLFSCQCLRLKNRLIHCWFIDNRQAVLLYRLHFLFLLIIVNLGFSFLMQSFLYLFWFKLHNRLLMILSSLVTLIYFVQIFFFLNFFIFS